MQVANTILAQLGGAGRLAMMCGCKQFVGGENSLSFKVGSNAKKVTAMMVTLDPTDTYTVAVFTGRGINMTKREELSDVYAEDLKRIFESTTGMYLSF